MHLVNKNYQTDPKIYQNFIWNNLCSLLPIQKVLKSNPIQSSLWLQILPNPSQRYDSSCEILRVVDIIHDILCKTFSIFYHSLHVWYHEILTNLMIFRLCFFLEFKNHSATRSWSCFLNKMFELSFHFRVRPHIGLNIMNIIFLLILFYYLNHLQLKFDLYQKNSL